MIIEWFDIGIVNSDILISKINDDITQFRPNYGKIKGIFLLGGILMTVTKQSLSPCGARGQG